MIVVERDALNPESDMHFNLIDILLVGYITWGIRRGRQRGLTNEATRAVLLLVAVLTGYSLVRWTGKALGQLASITGQGAGPLGVLGIMIATYVLARHFREQMRGAIARRFPDATTQRKGGAIAGALRTLVLGATVVVFVGLLPLGFLTKPFRTGSLVGRTLINHIVPVYETLNHTRPTNR